MKSYLDIVLIVSGLIGLDGTRMEYLVPIVVAYSIRMNQLTTLEDTEVLSEANQMAD